MDQKKYNDNITNDAEVITEKSGRMKSEYYHFASIEKSGSLDKFRIYYDFSPTFIEVDTISEAREICKAIADEDERNGLTKADISTVRSIAVRTGSNKTVDSIFRLNLADVINHRIDEKKPIVMGKTPNVLTLASADKNSDIIININTIRKCMASPEEHRHGHSLDFETMSKLPSELRNPIMLLKGSVEKSVVAVTALHDSQDREIIITVDINSANSWHNVNRITSSYGKDEFARYLQSQLKKNNLIAANKEKAEKMIRSLGLQSPQEDTFISYDDSITYTLENVNYPSEKFRRDNMKNQTEVIDNFKPDEVIEPKRKYIGNMNYRNLQDPITYKTEYELGLAIAEKLRQSNIGFSGVINEDKSISFSFDKKHQSNIYAFYDIRDSLEKQAHTAQRAETHKVQEQPSRDLQSDLKAILFQSVNNEYEKTVAFGQNDVSKTEYQAQRDIFKALYDIIIAAGLENEYQAWKNENTQETVKATERKSVQKADKSAYFGNTLQKFVPNKQFLKGVEKTVGIAVAAQLKEAKIKFAGHHNKDGSVTITYDGSKEEAVSKIVEAVQTSVSYSIETHSQEQAVTQEPVAEVVNGPQVPDVSYIEPVESMVQSQNQSVENAELISGKSSYNRSFGAARAARAAEEKRKTEAAEGQKTQPTRNNKNVGR